MVNWLHGPVARLNRPASTVRADRSRGYAPVCSCHPFLQRLAPGLQHIAPELQQLIHTEHAVVRQRHLTRRGDVPAADQPHIGHGLVGVRHGRVVTIAVRFG
jgi:hypothetical protein